jgi:hypothetical protein
MDTAYNGSMPYSCAGYVLAGCPDHQVKTLEQQSCAWMEGWATFWSMKVRNSPVYQNINLEDPTWGTPTWDYNGDGVEGHVAGALWDICDWQDDGWDFCYNQYDIIMNTLKNHVSKIRHLIWRTLGLKG